MKVYPIRIIGLLLMFIIEVWVSISDIESSQVFSFVAMLVAIFVLFVARKIKGEQTNRIKRIGNLIRNNIILISASLIFVVSIVIGIYLNEPEATLIGDFIIVFLAYVIVTELAIRVARASFGLLE